MKLSQNDWVSDGENITINEVSGNSKFGIAKNWIKMANSTNSI